MEDYNSIREFFLYLNEHCNYLILRNWDNVFNESVYGDTHEDIDILCDDLERFIQLTAAIRLHKRKDRDNFVIKIGEKTVRFDVRHVGDEYYPKQWEKEMLSRRIKDGDIYVMCKEDYQYSLIYHALLQKSSLSLEYRQKLAVLSNNTSHDSILNDQTLLRELKDYLHDNQYIIRIPKDPGVFINWNNLKYVGYNVDICAFLNRVFFLLVVRIKRLVKKVR